MFYNLKHLAASESSVFVRLTCFANLYSQFGQFALEDRLLFLWQAGFLLLLCISSLVTVQRLHFHCSTILCFSCSKEQERAVKWNGLAVTLKYWPLHFDDAHKFNAHNLFFIQKQHWIQCLHIQTDSRIYGKSTCLKWKGFLIKPV